MRKRWKESGEDGVEQTERRRSMRVDEGRVVAEEVQMERWRMRVHGQASEGRASLVDSRATVKDKRG